MVSYKTWLGRVVGQAFREAHKRTWNKYSTEGDGGYIGYATKKFINFPFEALQSMLISVYNKFYWITADLINQMGCNIGDQAMSKIDETLKTAKDYAMSKVNEARAYIQTNLVKPLEDKIKLLEPKVNDVIERIKTAETKIKGALGQIDQALSDVKKLDAEVDSVVVKVNATIVKMNDAIKNFDAKLGTFEGRIADANNLLDQHTNKLTELFDRVRRLEEERRQLLKIPSIREVLGL